MTRSDADFGKLPYEGHGMADSSENPSRSVIRHRSDRRPADPAVPRAQVAPVIVGPKNAEAATGWPWRWVRDTARALGVPFVGHGRKLGVRADVFLGALERAGALAVPADDATGPREDSDPAEAVRRALGKRRRAR